MTLQHIAARIRRLDSLFLGLNREVALIAKGDDPLLYLERQAYLRGLHCAASGKAAPRHTVARPGLAASSSVRDSCSSRPAPGAELV
jgi:hypothetical protein